MPYVIAYNSVRFEKDAKEGKHTTYEFPQVPYATWDTAAVTIGANCAYDSAQKCYKLEAEPDSPPATSQLVTVRVKAYFKIPKPTEYDPSDPTGTASSIDMDFDVEHVSMKGDVTITVGATTETVAQQTFPIGIVVIAINKAVNGFPIADIVSYNNKVNTDTVYFEGQSFAANKVLFDGAKLTNEIDGDGTNVYYASYQFRCITNPTNATWNKAPRVTGGAVTWYTTTPALFETAAMYTFIQGLQEGGGT